ncbi:MAG: hypothetical protein Q9211_006222 [Gyalolechia sp. 1 TL-2023]
MQGLLINLDSAGSACDSVQFVTVTETVTTTAKPSSIGSSPGRLPDQGVGVDTNHDVTTTLSSTEILTNTKIVAGDSAPLPLPSHDGNFYFVENNGETTWLGGKTPTSGAAPITSTLVVTVKPRPITETSAIAATSTSGGDATTTSVTTISSTSFYTHYLTKSLTLQTAPTADPSSSLPSHRGSYGWNATLARVHRPKGEAPIIGSTAAYPVHHATWLKRHHPRQIGAVVTATINGVVVSWTNSYGGEPQTTSSVTSIETSSANQAATTSETVSSEALTPPSYSWDSSPVPPTTSTVQLGSNASPLPSTPAVPTSTGVVAAILQQSSLSHANEASPAQISTQTSSSTVSVVESTPPFSNATQTSATSASCGVDTGRFTINFDDLPHFATTSPSSDVPPIFNPYRKLFFNGGYGYAPPPEDPYAPISPPQLAVYNYHNDSVSTQSIDAGLELHGEIGAGPRFNESAYWIDAYSTWIGCANAGPGECRINFIGYDRFNTQIATQTLLQRPCPGLVECKLARVTFTNQFRDLAGLQILAFVNKTPVTFYMDDLSLGWSNNTCAAQLERSSGE